MARITGTHKDGSMAAACANKLQVEVTHWDSEPTAEQLAQYPNSTWCSANGVGKSGEDVYSYDGNEKPAKSPPTQNTIDKVIMFVSLTLGVPVCLFLTALWLKG